MPNFFNKFYLLDICVDSYYEYTTTKTSDIILYQPIDSTLSHQTSTMIQIVIFLSSDLTYLLACNIIEKGMDRSMPITGTLFTSLSPPSCSANEWIEFSSWAEGSEVTSPLLSYMTL